MINALRVLLPWSLLVAAPVLAQQADPKVGDDELHNVVAKLRESAVHPIDEDLVTHWFEDAQRRKQSNLSVLRKIVSHLNAQAEPYPWELDKPYQLLEGEQSLDFKSFVEDQPFAGIGAVLGGCGLDGPNRSAVVSSLAVVESIVLAETRQRGLRVGDLIAKVDEVDAAKLKAEGKLISTIRGKPNSKVTLSVLRGSDDKQLYDVELLRRKFTVPTLHLISLEQGIAVIKIHSMSPRLIQEFYSLLETLQIAGISGLVLDLRGCPGGNHSSAEYLTRAFASKGALVYQSGSGPDGKLDPASIQRAREDGIVSDIACAAVIDDQTFGAAEILAAYLQGLDFNVVGSRSRGAVKMKTLIEVSRGVSIKAFYKLPLNPAGDVLDGRGVTPDIQCAQGVDPIPLAVRSLTEVR